jgi:hypothetical protein
MLGVQGAVRGECESKFNVLCLLKVLKKLCKFYILSLHHLMNTNIMFIFSSAALSTCCFSIALRCEFLNLLCHNLCTSSPRRKKKKDEIAFLIIKTEFRDLGSVQIVNAFEKGWLFISVHISALLPRRQDTRLRQMHAFSQSVRLRA